MNFPARRLLVAAPAPPSETPPPVAHHEDTLKFLDRHVSLEQRCKDQADNLTIAAVEISTLRNENEYLRGELAKTRIERERFAQGFFSLNAQMNAVTMGAVEATKSVAAAMVRALTAAKEEMLRVGMSPDEPEKPAAGDDGAAAIGAKLGANARQETEGA